MTGHHRYGVVILLAVWLVACGPPSEVRRSPPPSAPGLVLEPPVDEIQTVQLYSGREDNLPILRLGGGAPLTLEFDLVGGSGRPVSVFFFHADREWRRDLSRNQYLSRFDRDDLYDYYLSVGTRLSYAHYSYSFPNNNIGFLLSGNYILRVTEQGSEEAVLVETPFYVVEDVVPVSMDVQNLLIGRGNPSTAQPFLRFTPAMQLTGSVFDYHVCFIRGGQHASPLCSNRPSLASQPELLFYLEPEESFRSEEGNFYLDLRWLRAGGGIERIDYNTTPPAVVLSPDQARFPLLGQDALPSGQSVISTANLAGGDPDIQGEYVDAIFRYVPPDLTRLNGDIYIVGSFNGWRIDLSKPLRWREDEKLYVGSMLVKQGEHEYRYTSPDPEVRKALAVRFPRETSQYTGFVYFQDLLKGTDRLIASQNVIAR